jgi:periplasmic protein TonB
MRKSARPLLCLALAELLGPAFSAQAAEEQRVYEVGAGVSAPRLIEKAAPDYSDEAREARIEGAVSMSVEIHPDGRAHNIQVTRALGSGLDEQAIAAVEQWRFEPGLKAGEAVIVNATIVMNFRREYPPQR